MSWARSSRLRWRPNADAAERVRAGNEKAIGPIVGAVMRETKGRADGTEVTRLVHEQLASDTSHEPRANILDGGPKAAARRSAKMLA